MKRLALLLLILLPTSVALAGNRVPVSDARGKAAAFFNGAATSGKIKSMSAGSLKLVGTAPDDAFYIFNRDGGGFVIVSGDDAVGPYLAYSYSNRFSTDNMPDNVRNYLDALAEEVKYCREHPGSRPCSSSAISTTSEDTKVLATAQWSQYEPFNNLLPEYEGSRCISGCVATGMAILLKYKKWPEKGSGHLDGYSTSSLKLLIEGYDLGHTYDWDNMPLNAAGLDSYQENQMATIMRDCAVMIQTDFSPEGSGGHSEDVLPALVKYMGYDAGNLLEHRYKYSDEEWMAKIKESIDNDCPVLFAGEDDDSGHEFVVDGYSGDGYVDINFGWGGYANGLYLMVDMGFYPKGQVALFNLQKDKGSDPMKETLLVVEGDGLSMESSYSEDKEFTVSTTYLTNRGTDQFTGYLAIGLNSKDGTLQKIISETIDIGESTGYIPETSFSNLDFTCSKTWIKPGRSIQIYYKKSDSSTWVKTCWDKTKGTVGILYPAGEESDPLDDITFEYDKTSGIITMRFPKNIEVDCSFSAEGCWYFGDDWESGEGNKMMSIATNGLANGNYKITYTINGQKYGIDLPIDNSKRAK